MDPGYAANRGLSADQDSYLKADASIRKAENLGSFVISEDAALRLKKLRQRPRLSFNDNASWEVYDHDFDHHKQALDDIKCIACKELKQS